MDKYAYLITNRLGMACPMVSSPERLVEWCLTPGTEHEDGAQQPPDRVELTSGDLTAVEKPDLNR